MTRILLRKSEVLTAKAKVIFGDIVKEALYAAFATSEDYDHVFETSFNKAEKIEENFQDEHISFDGHDIVLIFTNGRCVNFTSSEWGSMATVSETEFEEEKSYIVYLEGTSE